MRYTFLLIALIWTFNLSGIVAQDRIGDVYLDKRDVFDSTKAGEWFFGANLMNSLHVLTKSYLIEDELLFKTGDPIDEDLIDETERNLRETGLFTNVDIILEPRDDYDYDVYVITQDKWSSDPNILFGTGGNQTNYGGRFTEHNFIGTGTRIMFEGLNRSENDIGWQGTATLGQRRLFRSELSLDSRILAHKHRTEQYLSLSQPYRTLSTPISFGVRGMNYFGSEYLYTSHNDKTLMPFHEKKVQAWFSKAWHRHDRVFATALLELEDVERTSDEFRRAMDNSGKFLLAFSSVAQDYIETTKLNSYNTEDFPEGGWGTAVLGKIFPIGSRGESYYYAGAQGERSWVKGDMYLFGQLTGGSAFSSSLGQYTYEEFLGLGFYRLTNDILLAARLRQQTVWNWDAQRQLLLDNDAGLRGYSANNIQGDNRIVANLEMRVFPDYSLWITKFSGVLFFDIGSAWRQDIHLNKTRWHSAIGFGVRIENTKTTGPNSILRIDFAYNFDERRFAEIIFTSDQLFSVFKKHTFKLPQVYGLEFDYE